MGHFYLCIKQKINLYYNFIKNFRHHCGAKMQFGLHYISDIKYKLSNLADTNLKLGLYHLYNQRFTDAILRFKLVYKYFNPGNKEAAYWLGWCYFFKRNIPVAQEYLKNCHEADAINLKHFVTNYNLVQVIPDQIWQKLRDIIAQNYINRFFSESINIPAIFIQKILQKIEHLPEEYNILELGSNIGILGGQIQKRFKGNFHLTGVECSKKMSELGEDFYNTNDFYAFISSQNIADFLENHSANHQHHLILSLCGLSYTKDLAAYLNKIYNILHDDGYFALCALEGEKTEFDFEHKEFKYNAEKLRKEIIDNQFIIIDYSNFFNSRNSKYLLFLCKKA